MHEWFAGECTWRGVKLCLDDQLITFLEHSPFRDDLSFVHSTYFKQLIVAIQQLLDLIGLSERSWLYSSLKVVLYRLNRHQMIDVRRWKYVTLKVKAIVKRCILVH